MFINKFYPRTNENLKQFQKLDAPGSNCDIVKEMYENCELKKVLEDKGINFKK